MSDLDLQFKSITKPLLIDDIAVKYSENKLINYDLLKKYIIDSSGKPLIILNDEKYHIFKAIGVKKINNDISCYFFSRNDVPNKQFYAYVAVFYKKKLTDFRTLYSNSENDFGAIFLDTKYTVFKGSESTTFDFFNIDNQGFIFEVENIDDDFKNVSFARDTPYTLDINKQFYIEDKVLLRTSDITGHETNQVLRNIFKKDLLLKQSFFIDSYIKNQTSEVIYLNSLGFKDDNGNNNVFEIIMDRYFNNEWIENVSISEYFILPNGVENITKYTLKR